MNGEGVLTVVSGFSGSGKGTVMKGLLDRYGGQYALSVSATTREPRPGEQEGREYFFVSRETFEQMIAGNRLLEYASYVGNYYGTPRDYVTDCLARGIDVLLEIEVQGARQIKTRFPEAVLVFVMPPSAEELRRRLAARGTETEEVIRARMKRAGEEALWMREYDYLLVNDTVDACVDRLHGIIQCQHYRPVQMKGLVSEIQRELKQAEGE